MNNHIPFMQRCLQLAATGQPWVAPNPMVGSVVVKNGIIIGEGYHKIFGGPHAEVNAIAAVADKSQLVGTTLYVNLEPCAHFGKTPPCTNLIIEHKIARVVVACLDPNPLVAGKGVNLLKEAGIEVELGVMEQEAKELNKRFMCVHSQKKPFIVLKWAQTADGYCGRMPGSEEPHKISNWYADMVVHQLRSAESAILIGFRTAITDNPLLTNRNWMGKNPLRVVVDVEGELPQHLKLFNDEYKTMVFSLKPKQNTAHVNYVKLNSTHNFIDEVIDVLYEKKVQSLLVEGGPKTLQQFINKNYWNETHIFTSDMHWGNGIKAPQLTGGVEVYTNTLLNNSYNIFKNNL